MSRVQPQPVADPAPHPLGAAPDESRPWRVEDLAVAPSGSLSRPTSTPRPAPGPGPEIPELLAPAGDWACAKAAVENGADAIYFGLGQFNARMRADNFTEADLPKLVEFLHQRGVKAYVTFNTLIFENEMAQAKAALRTMIAAGVDAVIVQDVGICGLIRRLSPDFPIHASTQMTITSPRGVEFARRLGCSLVVLARECCLKEIETIIGPEAQPAPPSSPAPVEGPPAAAAAGPQPGSDAASAHPGAPGHSSLPIEVFVHGALCVAYSGQCLTSEALGGRSANRGECAQACRMPYDLIADGREVPLGDRKYLLSPQDLAGLSVLPDLVRIGVTSLKIEGRLKSPEYVANITRLYRHALDQAAQTRPPTEPGLAGADGASEASKSPREARGGPPGPESDRYEMEMAFSRGLYTGWFHGTNNQELVHGRFGKKRGVYLGQVLAVERDRVRIELEGPLKPGDGVVFDAGQPEEKEEGGRVYQILAGPAPAWQNRSAKAPSARKPLSAAPSSSVALCFGRGDIDFRRVHPGDKVWKTSDPDLERRLRQSFAGDTPRFQRPITLEAHGSPGAPLTLIGRDALGHIARLDSAMPLLPAEKQPLTTELLRRQLGRLGGTPFTLGRLENRLPADVLLPLSELNRLRRGLVRELEFQRAQPQRWTLQCELPNAQGGPPAPEPQREPQLIVLVRSLAQLEAALECGVETLYCEFEDPRKYREAVAQFRRSSSRPPGAQILVAPPRVFKSGEEWILNQVRSCEADGWLLRNYDHLAFFDAGRRIGDYSLNIANRLAADYFKNHCRLERVTASYDLNFSQLEALLQAAPPEWFEVTIHQHMPMFHMEHCVFCAFLSQGTDYRNCGRPCDHHEVQLRDRVGARHPVKADAGCRNTVFNARAQTGADYVARMLALGVRHFRLEFLDESPEQTARTIRRYHQLIRGEITGPQLWRELKLFNQLGVTRGQIAG